MADRHYTESDNEVDLDSPFTEEGGKDALGASVPAVAESGTKNMIVVAAGILAILIVIYFIFSSDQQTTNPAEIVNVKGGKGAPSKDNQVMSPPPPPQAIDQIKIAPPPIIPPPPVNIVAPAPPPLGGIGGGRGSGTTSGNLRTQLASKETSQRIKSGMFVSGGGGAITGGFDNNSLSGVAGGFDLADLGDTSAATVKATKTNNPHNTIGMGKIIDAVMGTGVDTSLPGLLRAVVSIDVYAEKGRTVLIPRGSRLIGSYSSDIGKGLARIMVTWDRVVRPDGIDIMIGSPSADMLGRTGVEGVLDNRYAEILTNSILLSAITVGFAIAGDKAVDGGPITQGETGSGDATQSGDVSSIALKSAVDRFGSTVENVAAGLLNLQPYITIDQGTRIKVFVNKDVVFPEQFSDDVEVIQ